MGLSSTAAMIPPLIEGNWLDPMQSGAPQNFADPYVYINLDENEELDVNLIVSTTDFEMGNYDSLYIRWTFGNYTGVSNLITKDLMSPTGGGFYQAVIPRTIDFSTECSVNSPNTFRISILLELVYPKNGGYDIYPMANNVGLFDPAAFVDLTPTFSSAKMLLCWGATPPTNMVGNNNEVTATTLSENNEVAVQVSGLEPEIENEEIIKNIAVYPNPFSNTFKLQYYLERPSEVQFRIVDMKGSLIQYQKLPLQSIGLRTQTFSLEDRLSSGVYMIHLYYADRVKTTKLIKL